MTLESVYGPHGLLSQDMVYGPNFLFYLVLKVTREMKVEDSSHQILSPD